MGLWSKMCEWVMEWMDGYPLDCYDYQSTCGANKCLGYCGFRIGQFSFQLLVVYLYAKICSEAGLPPKVARRDVSSMDNCYRTGQRRACDARATVRPPWKNQAEEENGFNNCPGIFKCKMLPKMTKYRWLLKEMHLRSLIKPIFTGARNLGK